MYKYPKVRRLLPDTWIELPVVPFMTLQGALSSAYSGFTIHHRRRNPEPGSAVKKFFVLFCFVPGSVGVCHRRSLKMGDLITEYTELLQEQVKHPFNTRLTGWNQHRSQINEAGA